VPGELPPAGQPQAKQPEVGGGKRPATGKIALKVAEFKNDAAVFVPENYSVGSAHALVVWLRAPDAATDDDDALLGRWKDRCRRGGMILLAPRPADPSQWQRDDFEFIRKAIEQLRASYDLDPTRVVAAGGERGGALAYALAFHLRDLVRGVLAVQSPPGGFPPDNDPVYRLDFYLTTNARSRFAADTTRLIDALRERKYAVTVHEQAEPAGELTDDEAAEFLRWVDSLDKI
jgi:serine protease Do